MFKSNGEPQPNIIVYRNVETGKLEFQANTTDPVVIEDEAEMLAGLVRIVVAGNHDRELDTEDSRNDSAIKL